MKLFALLLVGVLIAGTFAVEDIVPAAKDVSKAVVSIRIMNSNLHG